MKYNRNVLAHVNVCVHVHVYVCVHVQCTCTCILTDFGCSIISSRTCVSDEYGEPMRNQMGKQTCVMWHII